MNQLVMLLLLVGCLGAFIGAAILGIVWAYYAKLRHLGSTIVLTMPEIPGTLARFERKRLKGGFIENHSKQAGAERDDKDLIVPAGPANYPTNWGPLQVMGSNGESLVAPSKLEAAKTIEYVAVAEWITNNNRKPGPDETKVGGTFAAMLAKAHADAKLLATRFLIWDPLAYRKLSRESVMQKLYQSTDKKPDPWYAAAALILGVILLVGFLAFAAMFVVKAMPLLEAAAAGS